MKIQLSNDKRSVSLTLGPEGFSVLVGDIVDVHLHSIVLLGFNQEISNDQMESILKAGVKVGCIYPTSLNNNVRDEMQVLHIFKGFNEPWILPYGWTVYPVSSGCGVNWLFKKKKEEQLDSSSSVIVCGESSIGTNCLYRQISQTSSGTLVHLSTNLWDGLSLDDIKKLVLKDKTVQVQVKNGVEAAALAVACCHYIASLDASLQGPVSITCSALIEQLDNVSSLYEWLSEDLQVYLMKCVKYVSNRNQENFDIPFVLSDLIDQKRITFNQKTNAKVSLSLSPMSDRFSPFPLSSTADLEQFYRSETTFS